MMNERIREFTLLAGADSKGLLEIEKFIDLEYFAELIVKECAGLVQGVPIDTMGYQSADQKIKEHFGVEGKELK